MAGRKRPEARIQGAAYAATAVASLGRELRASRVRRRMLQKNLAERIGISQALLAKMESGKATGTAPEVWFALAAALGRFLRFEFARDPKSELADAGHADIQEMLLRLAKPAGWRGGFELPTRALDRSRSIDVPLLDRSGRRLVVGECWNTFGDLGAAGRSSREKLSMASQAAVALGGDVGSYQFGLCWVIRDSRRNRELVARYQHIFEALLPGSSLAWVKALTVPGAPMPMEPGLVWCDLRATRVYARRRGVDFRGVDRRGWGACG